jgi:hypothetical protein
MKNWLPLVPLLLLAYALHDVCMSFRTRSGVSHGEDTRASVPQVEVLVLELLAVDALTTGALCYVSQPFPIL